MKNKLKRAVALGAVLLIVILLAATIVLAVSGDERFFGMLILTILVPVFMWVYSFIYKVLKEYHGDSK